MKKGQRIIEQTGKNLLLAVYLIAAIFPLFWIIITSLKSSSEIYTWPLVYFPKKISFESYRNLFSFSNFGVYFRNSLLVSLGSAFGALFICMFTGFSMSRIRSKKFTMKVLLALFFTQMVPGFILMIPLYNLLTKLNLLNSLYSLSLLYVTGNIAFGTIMAKGFFDRIPSSLEEAATIDGCNMFQALFLVILPVTLPGMAAIFCFSFVNIWNELFLAVLMISTESQMTVPVALNSFISKAGVTWDVMSAGIVIALIPTMIVFSFGQKYIVAGLTEGSVKG